MPTQSSTPNRKLIAQTRTRRGKFFTEKLNRPIHKFVSQAVQRFQRISLRLFQGERIYVERRNQGLSIVPISN